MSDDAFLGEIRPFANNFAPYGWLQCQGQILPIQQYAALFSLLGTSYGGNGTSNFALPNLMGNTLVGTGTINGNGNTYVIGETGGSSGVALDQTTIPSHNHRYNGALGNPVSITGANVTNVPAANVSLISSQVAKDASGGITPVLAYTHTTPVNTQLGPLSIGTTGNGTAHANQQPFLAINYCICMSGVFPTRP